jgi:hypothetical protein
MIDCSLFLLLSTFGWYTTSITFLLTLNFVSILHKNVRNLFPDTKLKPQASRTLLGIFEVYINRLGIIEPVSRLRYQCKKC